MPPYLRAQLRPNQMLGDIIEVGAEVEFIIAPAVGPDGRPFPAAVPGGPPGPGGPGGPGGGASAGMRPMDTASSGNLVEHMRVAYNDGYHEGQLARRAAMTEAAKRFGYTPGMVHLAGARTS